MEIIIDIAIVPNRSPKSFHFRVGTVYNVGTYGDVSGTEVSSTIVVLTMIRPGLAKTVPLEG